MGGRKRGNKRVLTRMELGTKSLELDAKGFLPLGFVPQQVHLAHFRDAAASMSQTVSPPEFALLAHSQRRLRGITRLRVCVEGQESCRFLPFPVNYLLGFAIDRV